MTHTKLYIDIDDKGIINNNKYMYGTIFNRNYHKYDGEIYLRWYAERIDNKLFTLKVWGCPKTDVYEVTLDETFDCRMCAKDILFYVQERIDTLKKL